MDAGLTAAPKPTAHPGHGALFAHTHGSGRREELIAAHRVPLYEPINSEAPSMSPNEPPARQLATPEGVAPQPAALSPTATVHPAANRRGRALRWGAAVAAIGLAATGAFLARGAAGDDEEIGYHPLDMPKPLADNIWIVDSGPFSAFGMKLPIRMIVIRLADGGLWLHAPTRYTPALAKALTALGPIRHLVAPTLAHWAFLEEWQHAYPDATVWAVPALRQRAAVQQSKLRIDNDLVDVGPAAWDAELEQGVVRGGGFEEAWFFHRASRTLVLTDLVENLDPAKLRPATAAVMRATRATAATSGLHLRALLRPHAEAVRRDVDSMVALAPETVTFAHGDIFRGRGTAQLASAFAWLR